MANPAGVKPKKVDYSDARFYGDPDDFDPDDGEDNEEVFGSMLFSSVAPSSLPGEKDRAEYIAFLKKAGPEGEALAKK